MKGSSWPSAIPLAICCGIDVNDVKKSIKFSLINFDKWRPNVKILVSKDMGLQNLNLRQGSQKCQISV